MTEDELYAGVVKILHRYPTILYHHCGDSRACDGQRGLPDLLLVSERGLLARELKDQYADTSAGQDLWGWTINCPLSPELVKYPPWAIWRPSDLASGLIEEEIQALAQK